MPFVYRVEDADQDSRDRYFSKQYRYRKADNKYDKHTPFHIAPSATRAIYGVWCYRDIVGAIAEQQRPGMSYFISRVDTAAFNDHHQCRDPAVADNADPTCHSAWIYYRVLDLPRTVAPPVLEDRFVSVYIDGAWHPKCAATNDLLTTHYRRGNLDAVRPTVDAVNAPLKQSPDAAPECAAPKSPDPGLMRTTLDQFRSWFRR